MSRATKFEATAADGQVFKRSSIGRTYTHCVAIHFPAAPADGNWAARPACVRAEWASSEPLARKNAAGWQNKIQNGRLISKVEILEARVAP